MRQEKCAELDNHWKTTGLKEHRVFGCLTPADALCYGNNYRDIQDSMCGNTTCTTAEQAKKLERHFFRRGKAQGRTFGCVGGDADALCYGNRYPALQRWGSTTRMIHK